MIEHQEICTILAQLLHHFAKCAHSPLAALHHNRLRLSGNYLQTMATFSSTTLTPTPTLTLTPTPAATPPPNREEEDVTPYPPQPNRHTNRRAPTKKTTRAGAPNYTAEDISALLDIVEREEPLGANHWAIVANKFALWASSNSRSGRDQDSLKNKFDKLANTKKKTGDPSCPEPVRRAKTIARAIHNKCAAMTLGDSSDGGDEEITPTVAASDGTSEENNVICERKKKRKTAATGTSIKAKTDQLLLEHIGNMTQHIGAISESIKDRSSSTMSRSEVVSIVQKEVTESMKPTTELLHKMKPC